MRLELADAMRAAIERTRRRLRTGADHRTRLQAIDTRIVVAGVRGKTTVTRWLHDIFVERGYSTYAKTTGTDPLSWSDGTSHPIERSGRVTLYENEREIRRYDPLDVLVLENHGIREYTTRLINSLYVDPQVIVLTNVQQDHLDTLGSTVREIAQSLARSVPTGAHVVTGERNDVVIDYLAFELANREATLERVSVPSRYADLPGAESVFLVEAVLAAVGEPPIDETRRAALLDELRVEWTQMPGGHLYDAAEVNDVESTERIRQALLPDRSTAIQPLVYLRRDRPGRTRSFLTYLNRLSGAGAIDQVRIVGDHREIFEYRATFEVIFHDEDRESAEAILDSALADGWPIMLMANAVSPFMDRLRAAIDDRAEYVDRRDEPTLPARTVLLVDPGTESFGRGAEPFGPASVLESVDRAAPTGETLFVNYPDAPASLVNEWDGFGSKRPGAYTRIAVGDPYRSASGSEPTYTDPLAELTLESIPDPTDIALPKDRIEAWLASSDEGASPLLAFHSVTAVHERFGLEGTLPFLEAVTRRLRAAGGIGVFVLDPTGLEPATVDRLAAPFDVVERAESTLEADPLDRDPTAPEGAGDDTDAGT